MQAYLGLPASSGMPVVYKRYDSPAAVVPWEIHAPETPDEVWSAYGSLFDAIDDAELETESEASQVATRRVREADPGHLRRLEFDGESAGTGIYAHSREDLEAALRIIGIRR